MRLKAKLISLTSLGLATLTIAPITLTSCSKGLIGKSFDLVKNYYPKTEKHEYAEISRHETHDIYRDQILNNPETFVEDYFWSKSWSGSSFDQYFFWEKLLFNPSNSTDNAVKYKRCIGPAKDSYSKDNENISNLKITTKKVKRNKIDWVYPCLSFTLKFDSKINQIILDKWFGQDNISGYLNGTVNGTITFYEVPFYIHEEIYQALTIDEQIVKYSVISFEPDLAWMVGNEFMYEPAQADSWKINTQVVSTINGEIKYNTGLIERVADDWTLAIEADSSRPLWEYDNISLYETVAMGFTSSYFLNNIKIISEEPK